MKRQLINWLRPIWIVLIVCVVGCGEEAPPAQSPKSVSKKIATQPAPQPATAPSPTASPKADEQTPPKSVEGSPAAAAAPTPAAPAAPSELVKESLQMGMTYDPAGRFDPFEPLFKEQQNTATAGVSKGKRDKRVPQTPLERVALSQLKLTAIIRAPSGNRALVEDATGKGYVIQKGTYIGLNSGRVVEIDQNRIVVEEEIENVMGELTIQNAEIKLQKPAGEF